MWDIKIHKIHSEGATNDQKQQNCGAVRIELTWGIGKRWGGCFCNISGGKQIFWWPVCYWKNIYIKLSFMYDGTSIKISKNYFHQIYFNSESKA